MAGWLPQTPRSGEAEPRRDALAAAGLACALFALFLGKEGQPLGYLAALELGVLSGLARDIGGLRGRLTRLPAQALVGVALLALSPWLFAAAALRPLPAAPVPTPTASQVALAEPTGTPIAAATTSAAAAPTPAPVPATPALVRLPTATPRPPTATATAVLLPAEPITRLAQAAPAARGGTSRPPVPVLAWTSNFTPTSAAQAEFDAPAAAPAPASVPLAESAAPAPQAPEPRAPTGEADKPQAPAQKTAKAQTPAPQAAATAEPELAWLDIDELPAVVKRGASAKLAVRTSPGAECKLEIVYREGEGDRPEKGLGPKKASAEGKADWSWKANGRGRAVITITAERGGQRVTKQLIVEIED